MDLMNGQDAGMLSFVLLWSFWMLVGESFGRSSLSEHSGKDTREVEVWQQYSTQLLIT